MINFAGGLIKTQKEYINPDSVIRFREHEAGKTRVEFTDKSPEYFYIPVENFADAMIEAGKTGGIVNILA